MLPQVVLLYLTCTFPVSSSFTVIPPFQSCQKWSSDCSLEKYVQKRSAWHEHGNKVDPRTPIRRRTPFLLATLNDGSKSSQDIEELYRQAMEDDAEWFQTFVSADLGDIKSTSTTNSASTAESQPHINLATTSQKEAEMNAREEHQANSQRLSASEEEMIDETIDSFMLSVQQRLETLGYTEEEISRINPQAVERILQNEIPPFRREQQLERGAEDDAGKEEEVSRAAPRQTQRKARRRPPEEDFYEEDEEDLIRGQRLKRSQKQKPRPSIEDSDAEYRDDRPKTKNSKRSVSKRPAMSDERDRKRAREERRKEDGELTGNRWWPGLAPFRDALRSETYFRAAILGPNFKDALKKEGKWRYQLYKDWLKLLKSGVGNDDTFVPLSAYDELLAGEEPRERRRRIQRKDKVEDERERRAEELRKRKREEMMRRRAATGSDENPARRNTSKGKRRIPASALEEDDSP